MGAAVSFGSTARYENGPVDSLSIEEEELQVVPGGIVFYLKGYVDTYNSHSFQRRISKAIESGYDRLVFHCAGLAYISSTGIGALVAFLKQLEPQDGDIALVQVQPKVYEVFQILGFSDFFAFADSIEEAARILKSGRVKQRVTPFPRSFACPVCSARLRATKSGRFRCSNCKTILLVDDDAQVLLG
ncbi:MAG: STAS domain-containing protein [Spirochaetaceae bacterium]